MATVTNNGLTGVVGSLVFYSMNGKQFARSKPVYTKKRLKDLSRSSQVLAFGRISKGVALLLGTMKNRHGAIFTTGSYAAARGWVGRINAAMGQLPEWPLESRFSNGCQLNPRVDLRNCFSAGLWINDAGNGDIRIGMGAMDPLLHTSVPDGCNSLLIRFFCLAPLFGKESAMLVQQAEREIVYRAGQLPPWETTIHTGVQAGDIALVAMTVSFLRQDVQAGTETDKDVPAAIIAMGRLV